MNNITNEQLFKELQDVRSLLNRSQFTDVDEKSMMLWSLQDIADYCQFTYRHVQSVVAAPYFPKPVLMPSQRDPNKPSDKPRWFAGEVVRYMKRRQH